MKIRRLKVTDFAGIALAELEFGDGLNVLYGPNDLGKSTLADAIRLGLLLPYTAAHIADYVPWVGGRSPVVEVTFQTEAQRFWRVTKEFRKNGSATLKESRNDKDYEQVVQGRGVDGRLREILSWGIPEPGGAGGKGLPTSFLATALLSTQGEVTAVLAESLAGDPTSSGKDQIARALQAVSQDPLFARLLSEAQARNDAAFAPKGGKKRGRDGVFKEPADRVRELQIEMQQLQAAVEDSENVEKQLRMLMKQRGEREEALAAATATVSEVENLAAQAAARAAAEEEVRAAREAVERIRQIDREIETGEQHAANLSERVTEAQQALDAAERQLAQAEEALKTAEQQATADSPDAATNDTVVRQGFELRRATATQAAADAARRMEVAAAALELVRETGGILAQQRTQEADATAAQERHEQALDNERKAAAEIKRIDLLERALAFLGATAECSGAEKQLEAATALRSRLESETSERDVLAGSRAALSVPMSPPLPALRGLEKDLAAARGALNVGLVVTVAPKRTVNVRVQTDAGQAYDRSTADTFDVEASSSIEITLGDLAGVRIRGGRRDTQTTVAALERRWAAEALPLLQAANVGDLDSLAARIDEVKALDASLQLKNAAIESVRTQLESMGDPSAELAHAAARVESCRAALGEIEIESLQADVAALGRDPSSTLRTRRQKAATAVDAARITAANAATTRTVAEERVRAAIGAADEAIRKRDRALLAFPDGPDAEQSAAQAASSDAYRELQAVASELASLDRVIAERARKIEEALTAARDRVVSARRDAGAAQAARNECGEEQAGARARLALLRTQRAAQDLEQAEARLHSATNRRDVLPQPSRQVTETEMTGARSAASRVKLELDRIIGDIHKAQGALEQVGGAVARERLREVTDACLLAELHEKEIEEEYEAWRLLLEQMKAADAAQASNLGQMLAPAIAGRFEELTSKRYQNVHIDAHLATQGVAVGGAIRPTDRMSVGTREQLSTLYRLALAEYLNTTVVLDDQLVQSDVARMDWFRRLLVDKAAAFQIIVFTCRPEDYLSPDGLVPPGQEHHDSGPLLRTIDLERVVQRA